MNDLKYLDFLNRDGLNSSTKDDLVLFDYSKETQFNKDWDEVTLNARGIVFNSTTGELIVRPTNNSFDGLNVDERLLRVLDEMD